MGWAGSRLTFGFRRNFCQKSRRRYRPRGAREEAVAKEVLLLPDAEQCSLSEDLVDGGKKLQAGKPGGCAEVGFVVEGEMFCVGPGEAFYLRT